MNRKKEFYISNVNFIKGNKDNTDTDLSFMPAIQRRKLSPVDTAAMCVMHGAYPEYQTEIVFASRYGELDRLDKIISQYQEDNEVSPFAFSTSVHNSVAGQFSLLNGIKKSYNALASDENTFSTGLLDSIVRLNKDNDVLYCYADAYKKVTACAMLLSQKPKENSIKVEILQKQSAFNGTDDEFEEFQKFVEGEKDSFCAADGLFFIKKGAE